MAVRFNVLGPMEVVVGDRDLTPTAPKIRQVLALLISRHNTLVHTSEIVDELWGERPPASALVTLQTYIYKLRKLLFALLPIEERVSLRTRYSGYLIITPAENIDQYRFEELARQGRAELESGSVRSAAERLRSALSLWRGPGLGGIEVGSLLTGYLTRLEESRLRVLQNRIEADLSLGRHRELISELKELTVARSLDEGFHGQLMSALNLAGRRSEALDVYRRFRRNLIDQLGLEPSAELQNRHNALLSGEVTTTEGAESPTIGSIGPSGPGGVACVGLEQPPAQLPHDIADFVGRAGLLNDAADWLTPGAAAGAGLRVLALSGMPGVGKTSLACGWDIGCGAVSMGASCSATSGAPPHHDRRSRCSGTSYVRPVSRRSSSPVDWSNCRRCFAPGVRDVACWWCSTTSRASSRSDHCSPQANGAVCWSPREPGCTACPALGSMPWNRSPAPRAWRCWA